MKQLSIAGENRTRNIDWGSLGAIVVIIIVAAALRLYGIKWGLPNSLHSYSYHPDEFLTVGTAFGAIYLNHSLNPRFYNYPSLYLYLSAIAIAVVFGYGAKPTPEMLYLAPRMLAAVMGTTAVIAAYWAGNTLFNKHIGIGAALILAIAPLHVQHSHFATVDVPSTLFIAACLGFAGLILKRGDWKDYVFAGIMAGLAAGTKYNAGLVILAPIAAHFLRDSFKWRMFAGSKLWVLIGCTMISFIITTPGTILWNSQFMHAIAYEARHTSTGHGLVFAGTGNGFVYNFTNPLLYGLGPFAFVFLFAAIWSVIKRDRQAIVLLAFILPYYVLISMSQVRFARYMLPIFPAVAILASWLVQELVKANLTRKAVRYIIGIAAACLVLVTLAAAINIDSAFRTEPQDMAARWIFKNISKGSSIGFIDVPWFYSPPLSNDFGFGTLPQRQEQAGNTPYKITVFSRCKQAGCWFEPGKAPKWVVISDFEISDAIRLKNNKSITSKQREEVNRILKDFELVKKNYKTVYSAGGGGAYLKLHDMHYTSPEITIYRLKK